MSEKVKERNKNHSFALSFFHPLNPSFILWLFHSLNCFLNFALSPQEQAFIRTHITDDVAELLLRSGAFPGVDLRKVAAQIVARQKAKTKLPHWYAHDGLLFPPPLSVEQASSADTANYKASLVSGAVLLDLTAGMGVDTAAFANQITKVVYADQQSALAALAEHNLAALGHKNVTVQAEDGLTVLQNWPGNPPDWVYLDPARRDDRGGKLVRLADCEPNLTNPVWRLALQKAQRILLKTSPLIDIDGAIRQLPNVAAVHVVAVENEVKEVLFIIDNRATNLANDPAGDYVKRTAINLLTTDAPFCFSRADERTALLSIGDPMEFVYEPNAALLKAGAFRVLGERFGMTKLAPHSHIYTANHIVADFPGRTFRVDASCKPDRKAVQALVPGGKANLTTRNFPQPTDELRRQLGLRDGGNVYILATTLSNNDKRLLICHKVINPT